MAAEPLVQGSSTEASRPTQSESPSAYHHLTGLPAVPHPCLRLPTPVPRPSPPLSGVCIPGSPPLQDGVYTAGSPSLHSRIILPSPATLCPPAALHRPPPESFLPTCSRSYLAAHYLTCVCAPGSRKAGTLLVLLLVSPQHPGQRVGGIYSRPLPWPSPCARLGQHGGTEGQLFYLKEVFRLGWGGGSCKPWCPAGDNRTRVISKPAWVLSRGSGSGGRAVPRGLRRIGKGQEELLQAEPRAQTPPGAWQGDAEAARASRRLLPQRRAWYLGSGTPRLKS